jgi:hypothetical protein
MKPGIWIDKSGYFTMQSTFLRRARVFLFRLSQSA